VLGRFRLENIRPAPRGVPQIEVTFDIDANGILHVSARDKDTGAEQRITISETSNLNQSEIERMVADAEAHRSEDAALRAQVDGRNELDTVAYQVRRTLEDNAGAIPEHERARAELLLNDARTALEEQADIDRLRALTGEMHQLLQSLAASARAGATAGASAGPTESSPRESGGDDSDDVIDAEFTAR
jgi:molecular chaperone DnaK